MWTIILIIEQEKYHVLQFALLTRIIVQDLASDHNFEPPEPAASCKACMASHEQNLVGLAACESCENSTFEQMPEFPGVRSAYRLRVKRSGPQGYPFHKDDLGLGAENSPI
jgi:hypothetical protein